MLNDEDRYQQVIKIWADASSQVTNAMLEGCNLAVKIAFSLIGIMAFWLGLMEIAETDIQLHYLKLSRV